MGRMTMFTDDTLDTILTRLGRRLRLRDGWRLAQRTLWIALAVAVFVQIIARLWPVDNAIWWTLIPLVLWLPAVAVWTLARPLSPSQIARRVDVELHLKERLSTAWTLTHVDPSTAHPHHFDPDLLARQQDDALVAARSLDPARDFPLTWLLGPLRTAAALVVTVLVLALLPNPMDQILAERAAIARAAEDAAERVEELAEEVEASTELTPEDREELARSTGRVGRRSARQLAATRKKPRPTLPISKNNCANRPTPTGPSNRPLRCPRRPARSAGRRQRPGRIFRRRRRPRRPGRSAGFARPGSVGSPRPRSFATGR
ncbi:MAG: hypothetical protein R2873_33365 [Caldilineaceae bacterium]